MRRWLLTSITVFLTLMASSCISKDVRVPVLLTPIRDARLSDLVDKLNQYQAMQSMTARLDVQFQSDRNAEQGLSRLYRTAEGLIVLARPGKLRLQIQVPIVKTNIAELASDGNEFAVLVHPKEYRTYIRGTRGSEYAASPGGDQIRRRREEAGGFARIRPEHFTDALLFPKIDPQNPQTVLVKEEVQNIEPDTRPNAPRNRRVIRTFWVLSVIERGSGAEGRLRRKYWFDRTGTVILTREQVFGQDGQLQADVSFGDMIQSTELGLTIPTYINIHRPHDEYSVRLNLNASTVSLNVELPDQAFKLEKPPDWGDEAQVIDLDKKDGG